MQILEYCVMLGKLLFESDEKDWSKLFYIMALRLEDNEKPQEVFSEILGMYGGMGSLNDIILYQDGNIDIERSNKLDLLRKGLFLELVKQRIPK